MINSLMERDKNSRAQLPTDSNAAASKRNTQPETNVSLVQTNKSSFDPQQNKNIQGKDLSGVDSKKKMDT